MYSPASFDLHPTDRLSGLHMVGMVTRRFLISYPVHPECLSAFLPSGAELLTYGGYAWVSACFVNIKRMRPSFLPDTFGMEFNYLIHRTRARLQYPDRIKRESVLVLEPNINNKLFVTAGLITPGISFMHRQISLTETADAWTIVMKNKGSAVLFDAEITKSSVGVSLPPNSVFPDLEQADQALLGVSYGAQWNRREARLRLFAETHEPWLALAGTCRTKTNAFLSSLAGQHIEADHVITMENVPHYFALNGMDTNCPC